MQLDSTKVNRILLVLGAIILIGGGLWCIFLNEAQRWVVGIGMALAILNLMGASYFFNRNNKRRR